MDTRTPDPATPRRRRHCACKAHVGRYCPIAPVRGSRYCALCQPVESELRAMDGNR